MEIVNGSVKFDSEEMFDFDRTLASIIGNALIQFVEYGQSSYPDSFADMEQWESALMVAGKTLLEESPAYPEELTKEVYPVFMKSRGEYLERRQKALSFFIENFNNLWD